MSLKRMLKLFKQSLNNLAHVVGNTCANNLKDNFEILK